jgi:Leucine-rich repeat (LRR) protein
MLGIAGLLLLFPSPVLAAYDFGAYAGGAAPAFYANPDTDAPKPLPREDAANRSFTAVAAAPKSPSFVTIGSKRYSTSLTELALTGEKLTSADIKALKYLSNLTSLDLSDNYIGDIGALAGLVNLTWIEASSNDIRDVGALADLTKLTWLSLDDNDIDDVKALAGLSNLGVLNLHNNDIRNVDALAGLSNLTLLNLENNNISDIAALSKLSGLRELRLTRNPFTRAQADALRAALPEDCADYF